MRFTSALLLLASAVAAFSSASAVTPCPATGDRSAPASSSSPAVVDENVIMYVGAYTRIEAWVNGTAKGINTFSLNTRTGALTHVSETEVGINPTFIRGTSLKNKSKNKTKKQYLYVVNEVDSQSVERPGTTTGYVVALEVTGKGQLKVLNRVETRGNGPIHVSMSPNEDFVTASMYLGGGVIMYPVNKTDGSLEPASDSHFYTEGSNVEPQQTAAHLHSMTWVPGTQLVFGADLGADQIVQYKLDAATNKKLDNSTLPIIKRPPGSGPRHMDIHPSGKIAYVADEFANTIGVYVLNPKDKSLPSTTIQNIATLPADFNGTSTTADIHVSADGRFVYSSNRGHDSISIFEVTSQVTGELAVVGHESTRGDFPRSFLLFKDLLVVANQNSGNLEVFRRKSDGTLAHTGQSAKSNSAVSVFIPEQ
ncbi:hypothetical protein Gpo141_00014041 [Globisporangium polare]